ncbi:hypothetical protein [Pontibacter cellulosilyticus]|uniref:Uncharacterized protein n=1 Tax=Pontibacter cellulosilyticus TaxID=1720253 RepID=A0A923N6Y6_9BACT|nr:hypothetical protein [Pontibacter cellulosilyticus]MBC5994020.1 hypothetical protein [Pontibacter cellulosilyticus]
MSKHLYQTVPLAKRSLLQRLLGQHPEENAVIELNNLLASKQIQKISRQEVGQIAQTYQTDFLRQFQRNMEEFYAVYLNHCLQDNILSQDELQSLKHLRGLLQLDERTVEGLHAKIGEQVYKASFEKAVADGRITPEEKAFLEKLEADLKLPEALAKKISEEVRGTFIQNYVASIIADERLSPSEEQELEAIAANLNVTLEVNEQTKRQLQQLKLYWALENAELPSIQPDILLQKSEKCYISIPGVKWHELRTVRHRTSYSGYSTSFRVAKGFYLRSGSYTPRSYSTDEMKLIDSGTLYLTSKRLIFAGSKKNSIIHLTKILSITPYSDGLEIGKDTGKSPLLQLPNRTDVFSIMLERLLRERA